VLRNTRLQMTAMLAVGGLLGYAAAAGKLDLSRRARAEPPQNPVASKVTSSVKAAAATCCAEGSAKGELLALADPRAKPSVSKDDSGKKPNILFIMGDDIGWMQPQCYHRGLMVGETPNIDRIAREGGMFMHYYAESSCTAGRCAFITGMHPYRR
jgi:hypothetical protein